MAVVNKLTTEELGAVLIALGQLMLNDGLCIGAALDGNSKDFIRSELEKLLGGGHGKKRLNELAAIDEAQVMQCMNSADWI